MNKVELVVKFRGAAEMVVVMDCWPGMASVLLLLTSILTPAFSLLAEGPKDLLVASGSPASLSCRSTNPQSSSVTWLRSGAPLPPSPTSLLLPDGELFLLTTQEKDSGSYSCIVTDSDGVFHSLPATLTVIDKEEDEGSLDSTSEDSGRMLVMPESTEEGEKDNTKTLSKSSEEREIEEAILAYESSEDFTSLTAPVVTLATISNPGTGVVQWASVPAATSYIVRVFAADWEVTNITVERGVDTVRLHNLADNIRYSVMVASRGEDGTSSPFSPPSPLVQSSSLPSSTPSPSLPSSLWITAISILVVLTILTIIGAALILTRLRGFQKVATNPESQPSGHLWGSKRMSWVDPRWGAGGARQQQQPEGSPTNQQAALISPDTTYTYASSSSSSRGEDSNHYAYVDIVREGGLHSFR